MSITGYHGLGASSKLQKGLKPLRAEVCSVLSSRPEAFLRKGALFCGILTHGSRDEGSRKCTDIAIHSWAYNSHTWESQESTSHFYKWRNQALERYTHASLWARNTSGQKAYEKPCLMRDVFGCGETGGSHALLVAGVNLTTSLTNSLAISVENLNLHILSPSNNTFRNLSYKCAKN